MFKLDVIYQLVIADFRERTRRYSFLIMLLGALFFGYLVITGKWSLSLGQYRGEYNSAWVGSLMASASTIMLAFFGFYLVKNSLSRDRRTGVGQILSTTPMRGVTYLAAKFCSNFAVLTLMAVVLAGAAVAMQLLSRVEGGFDLWDLVAPFLFVCLPTMTLVAAMAVLFESFAWLRGTFGNILYLVVAEFAFMNTLLFNSPFLDFGGLGLFIPSMEAAALEAYPGANLGLEMGFVGVIEESGQRAMKLFRWDGIDWSLGMVPLRLLWVGCAIGLTGVASLGFDRFDPARAGYKKKRKRTKKPAETIAPAPGAKKHVTATSPSQLGWREVAAAKRSFNPLRMLKAELRLMLKGYHWSWYAIAIGLIATLSAVPYEYARAFALPAVWIWPLPLWSAMGTREARFNTGQLVFSSPYPVSRQFPAVWAAGAVVALIAGGGMIVRDLVAGDAAHLQTLLVAVLFVPTLALALGALSGTKKLFEVLYLLVWYVGPVNRLAPLDFLGAGDAAVASVRPVVYLTITLLLILAAFFARRQRVASGA